MGLYHRYNHRYNTAMVLAADSPALGQTLSDLITFESPSLARRWRNSRVPMSDFYEAYIDGRIDIPAQSWDVLFAARHELLSFRITRSHVRWAISNFLPEVAIHS